MVVFAFANTPEGGFFVASSAPNMEWIGLPSDLEQAVEDVRRNGEEMVQLSTGLNGDWFLRTKSRHAHRQATTTPSSLDIFRLLDRAQYLVQSFFFVPEPTGYICVLHNPEGTQSRCAWRSAPTLLSLHLSRGVRHVAVGVAGAYVVVLNTGAVWWDAVPGALAILLVKARKSGRNIQTVSLSLVVAEWFFIAFADGAVHYHLPEAWHSTIDRRVSPLPPPQLESEPRSPPPRAALPDQWSRPPSTHRPASSTPWSSPSSPLNLYSALDFSMAIPPAIAFFTDKTTEMTAPNKKPDQYKLSVRGMLYENQNASQMGADGTSKNVFDGLSMF